MEQKPRVGIVAALRREIAPLVRQRRTVCLAQPNRRILIFESDGWVAGCGGIGKVAAQAGVPFVALKSISDELDFPMPPLQRFIQANGSLAKARLFLFLLLCPWHWQAAIALARNSRLASLALTQVLRHQIDKQLEAAGALHSK